MVATARFGRHSDRAPGRSRLPARVLIADSEPVFAAGAATVLAAAGLSPVPLDPEQPSVLEQAESVRPGALLLDADLAARPYGSDLIEAVVRAVPGIAVVVLVRRPAAVGLVSALEAGARALVHRRCTAEELVAALAAALADQNWVSSELAGTLRAELLGEASGSHGAELSRRELEVLAVMATGATNSQIGQDLGISQHTVRNHVQSLMRKLGVSTRTDAVATGMRAGLIDIRD